MRNIFVAAMIAVLGAASAAAHAAQPEGPSGVPATPAACLSPLSSPFRPEAELHELLERALRYSVAHVDTDAGCYAVLASDRRGTHYEVRFLGADLKMVSRRVVKAAR